MAYFFCWYALYSCSRILVFFYPCVPFSRIPVFVSKKDWRDTNQDHEGAFQIFGHLHPALNVRCSSYRFLVLLVNVPYDFNKFLVRKYVSLLSQNNISVRLELCKSFLHHLIHAGTSLNPLTPRRTIAMVLLGQKLQFPFNKGSSIKIPVSAAS